MSYIHHSINKGHPGIVKGIGSGIRWSDSCRRWQNEGGGPEGPDGWKVLPVEPTWRCTLQGTPQPFVVTEESPGVSTITVEDAVATGYLWVLYGTSDMEVMSKGWQAMNVSPPQVGNDMLAHGIRIGAGYMYSEDKYAHGQDTIIVPASGGRYRGIVLNPTYNPPTSAGAFIVPQMQATKGASFSFKVNTPMLWVPK